jgi:hypothetical protein
LENNYKNNTAMLVYQILQGTLNNELREISSKYCIPIEELHGLAINLFVRDTSKVQWKSGRTRFVKAYVTEVIMLIDENMIEWEDLGFMLYLSSKFTNFEDNTLRKKDDGSYIIQKDLAKVIYEDRKGKVSERTIKRRIAELVDKQLLFTQG